MKKDVDRHIQVVAALIVRNGQLLVCQRRAMGAFPFKWEFPGGKIEPGESEFEALRRELIEELAIMIHGAEFFDRYQYSYENGPTVALNFYRVMNFAGEPKNLAFERILWVRPEDLQSFDFLDGDRQIIEQIVGQQPVP